MVQKKVMYYFLMGRVMENKLYNCQIPGCKYKVSIRSTIKTGEYKGKKSCQGCKQKIEGIKKKVSKLKPYNKKTMDKRKEERKGLPEFFKEAIEYLKENPNCMNCGCSIETEYQPHWNVCHLLEKSKYKSVMTHPLNYILLCSSKDPWGNNCHEKFDERVSERPFMECWDEAKRNFEILKPFVLEKGKTFRIFEENK